MHDSKFIANKFVGIARDHGNTLTPMQLLKLVYIAHGWMLGLYHVPLIRDRVEAWKFGPVIPKLYHELKGYKDGPVLNEVTCSKEDLVEIEDELIQQVYDIYGELSGIALSNLTHEHGSPWEQVFAEGVTNIVIPNDMIEEHYRALANPKA